MFLKSIRFKIVIVYMVILAITLFLFSAILYNYLSRNLEDNMDTLLRSKAEDIAHAVNTYWNAERLAARRYGELKIGMEVDFNTIAQRWVQAKSKDPKLLDIIVQIFDADGNEIASSKHTQGIANVSPESFASVLQGKSCFDTVSASFPTRQSAKWRVFITPILQNDRVEYVVQVASLLSSIENVLSSLRFTLLLLLPITVLLTAIMGVFLANLTLRPVDSMIKDINDIKAENLKLKIAVPTTKDEIQKLAETFNDMLERLDVAFTSQKRLFEDLSHELKTPLAIMKGEFEVSLKKKRTPEEYEEILISSLEEVNRIARLVENLLLLASFESKKILPDKKDLDLVLLVQGVVNSIKKLADQKHIDVSIIKGSGDSIVLNGDEQQLKQLFFNLLDNAVKYTPPDGKITVGIDKESSFVRVSVKDTGKGIPKEELGHIFERFYRVSKFEAGKGFGLGLGIAKSIVDAHNGTILVESRINQGTIFKVSLPAQ